MNDPLNWAQLTNFAEDTAKEAGKILLTHLGKLKNIRGKSGVNDMVTEADLASESYIIRRIQSRFPGHSVISEENPQIREDSPFQWIVDPLDGTTNFIHEFPEFAVSIGIQYLNQTVAGIVYNPFRNECFSAYLNDGARLNGIK
ncbi:MAG: inositol monophosphatase family protein, partial [Fidelibacterota bacterium]